MKRTAHYCQQCGTALVTKKHNGHQRPICPQCQTIVYHDPKVAVVVVILQGDEVLLVQRAHNPGQGLWACPAGFVDYNEPPEFAAIREVQEETGLLVQIDHVVDVFPRKDDGLADIAIAYEASVVGGTLQAGDDAADVGWFKRDELPDLVFYPSIKLIGIDWRNGRF